MALLAIANRAHILLLSALIEGLAGGIAIPMILALISDRSKRNEQGKFYALCFGGFDLGMALAGPVLGKLEKTLSYSGLFFLATILSAIAIERKAIITQCFGLSLLVIILATIGNTINILIYHGT